MKPIDIYSLTRVADISNMKRIERQMSARTHFLNIKKWEIECLKEVADRLLDAGLGINDLNFYYSFQIPKLGKEFDLLKITGEYVINIELKSGGVTDEKVKRQLLKNRYYLASLGKTVKSYTYINDEDRLVRLSSGDNLIETDFASLVEDVLKMSSSGNLYEDDIESLFKEENYIISPLTDPERFLRRDYFLTSQQHDIRNHIVKNAREKKINFQGFTGLPGTGKTLLLYDIAMELSYKQKVCVLHFGSCPDELEKLDDRLKRIDFYKCQCGKVSAAGIEDSDNHLIQLDDYQVIAVDEGHRITEDYLGFVKKYALQNNIPVIFSYDSEDAISPNERMNDPALLIEALPEYAGYKLTNRIRMNRELSTFINCLMQPSKYRRLQSSPNITVSYANDFDEANIFLQKYIAEGYVYISKKNIEKAEEHCDRPMAVSAEKATCKEYDKVVMKIGSYFSYDEDGYLRYSNVKEESPVRALFHGLNRAKKQIALVIVENDEMLDAVLRILQGDIG